MVNQPEIQSLLVGYTTIHNIGFTTITIIAGTPRFSSGNAATSTPNSTGTPKTGTGADIAKELYKWAS